MLQFLNNAVHPKRKAPLLRMNPGGEGSDSCHQKASKNRTVVSLSGDPCRAGDYRVDLRKGRVQFALWKTPGGGKGHRMSQRFRASTRIGQQSKGKWGEIPRERLAC